MPEATKTKTQTRQLPKLDTRAAFVPGSINEEEMTADFCASTGARGLRQRFWDDDFYEELEISKTAIRMGRINNGAPFCKDHMSYTIDGQIGGIVRGWIEGGKFFIRVKFSSRDGVKGYWQDVKDGILRTVSVGYVVHEYQITDKQGELDVLRAVDWEPYEVSLVAIGFDDDAKVRSQSPISYNVRINDSLNRATEPTTTEEENMPDTQDTKSRSAEATPEQVTKTEVREAAETAATNAVSMERARTSDIYSAVRKAKLSSDFAEELVREGVGIDKAREKIINKVADQEVNVETRSRVVYSHGDEETNLKMRSAVSNAIQHKADVSVILTEEGRQFRGMSMMEQARYMLEARGHSCYGMTRMQLATRALGSKGDMPHIMMDASNKTLRDSYNEVPNTFEVLGKRATASDFKMINRISTSAFSDLKKVNEHGEFERGSLSDAIESYMLVTYGRDVDFTREMLMNDDMSALADIFAKFGASGARLEGDVVWGHILSNPIMGDAKALFHADHGNIITAAAIGLTSVAAARKAFRNQTMPKGKDGKSQPIGARMRYLVCGADKETEAEAFLTPLTATKNADVIPAGLRNALTLVVEDRIEGNAHYGFAAPGHIDTFEYCYLEGESGVHMESEVQYLTGAIRLGCRHDFAAKAIDWRGMTRNTGL